MEPVPYPEGAGVDTILGPEMKSTGEVMGIDAVFGTAFAKSQAGGVRAAAHQGPGLRLRRQPRQAAPWSSRSSGWPTSASRSSRPRARPRCCAATGCASTVVRKYSSARAGRQPTIVDAIQAGEVDLIVNTPYGKLGGACGSTGTRSAPLRSPRGIPCITTIQGLAACVQGIEALDPWRHRGRAAAGIPCDLAQARSLDESADSADQLILRRTTDAAGPGSWARSSASSPIGAYH